MPTTVPAIGDETIGPDEARVTADFIAFLSDASRTRHPTGPMPRFNQGRAAGCVDAEFSVSDGLAGDLRVGLFAHPKAYRARIRFASAASQSDVEKDVRGMSIKVWDTGPGNLTEGMANHDFILNSHPVMMVGASPEFLDLLRANEAGGARRVLYFVTHPRAAAVAIASRQHSTSHLEIPYWSTTPYLFGAGRAVKYVARPVMARTTPVPEPLTANYLHERLVERLAREDVTFEFLVQFQTNARTMPIEDASVEWSDRESPYRPVARIRIPRQVVDAGEAAACERLSFNPWSTTAEHRPLGNYNRTRRAIYTAMANLRGAGR